MRHFIAAMALLALDVTQSPVPPVLGTWRGTSLCVDKKIDTACHDEQTIYVVDSAGSPHGTVRMGADKVVNGVRENMGSFTLTYDATSHSWSADLNTRVKARWAFTVNGDSMSGTLKELPSNRLVRVVTAKRTVVKKGT